MYAETMKGFVKYPAAFEIENGMESVNATMKIFADDTLSSEYLLP